MKAIADALVYAVAYISIRTNADEGDDDADVGALESIAAGLRFTTDEEKDALAAAADRALEEELGSIPRPEFLQHYATWMADVFGDDEWVGNKRK